MGLSSSKESREVTVTAQDVGVIRITEAAVENLAEAVEDKNAPKQPQQQQQQQKHVVVNENDLVAAKRLEEYEANLVKSFKSASQEVEQLFRDRYKTVPVCLVEQDVVMQCYKQNPKYPLKCLDLAEKYTKCVENERLNRFKGPTGA